MQSNKEKSIELEAKKNFNELFESCENLTTKQKRVAFTRIVKDEVEPGEVGVAVRRMLSECLETLDAREEIKKDSVSKETTIQCKNCNNINHSDANYCENCGIKLVRFE